MFANTGLDTLDTPVTTEKNLFDKPWRMRMVYGNRHRGVFWTCSWAPCGSPGTTTGRQRISTRHVAQGGVDPRQLFADKASEARNDRPSLKQALASVPPGDCLVVWTRDRLGRSLSHLLQIVTTLQARGVAFRSLTEQMDIPQGVFLFSVFSVLAQYERALTQERIKAGLAAAKRRGKRGGRPQAISDEKLILPIFVGISWMETVSEGRVSAPCG